MTSYAYTLTLPSSLFNYWGWFEQRGYLPEMPGTLITEDEEADEMSLGLAEHEAWEFNEACDALGEGYGSCVANLDWIERFRGEII